MAAIETPLTEIAGAAEKHGNVEKDALIAKLDELLEKYLHTLDEYQEAREQLSKQLSSGYMCLAQANFQNRSSSVHYGQDCYDERMQALRHVNIHSDGEDPEQLTISISSPQKQETKTPTKELSTTDSTSAEEANDQETSPKDDNAASETKETKDKTSKNTDPLRWFGILVPPSLRSAQASFISAVEGPVSQLVNISRDLRGQEIEIGRVKKQIKKL